MKKFRLCYYCLKPMRHINSIECQHCLKSNKNTKLLAPPGRYLLRHLKKAKAVFAFHFDPLVGVNPTKHKQKKATEAAFKYLQSIQSDQAGQLDQQEINDRGKS